MSHLQETTEAVSYVIRLVPFAKILLMEHRQSLQLYILPNNANSKGDAAAKPATAGTQRAKPRHTTMEESEFARLDGESVKSKRDWWGMRLRWAGSRGVAKPRRSYGDY